MLKFFSFGTSINDFDISVGRPPAATVRVFSVKRRSTVVVNKAMHRSTNSGKLRLRKPPQLLLQFTYAIQHSITKFATMLWTWITVTLLVMFVTWIAVVVRFRSSISKAADDLHVLARKFRNQAQQLTSVRQSERESKRDSAKKAKELAALRTRVQALTTSLNSVTAERNTLKSHQTDAEARITRLSEQLAAAQASNQRLRVELEDATEMRWKLTSRIHTDAAQRLHASHHEQTTHLSTPHANQPTTPSPTLSVPPDTQSSTTPSSDSNHHENSAAHASSVIPFTPSTNESLPKDDTISAIERDLNHSVSFENLLNMKPDLSLPEHDQILDDPSQLDHTIPGTSSEPRIVFNDTVRTVRKSHETALSLDRAPWVDTVNPDLAESVTGSIAAALQPTIAENNSGWIVSGMRSSSREPDILQPNTPQSTS